MSETKRAYNPRRERLPLDNIAPAILRFREIVAEAGDHLLTEGPVEPDHRLLDLCSEALHLLVHAERAHQGRPMCHHRETWPSDHAAQQACLALDKEKMKEWQGGNKRAQPVLLAASKIKATTAAGIYAKAMCVRTSTTGAAGLAMSLAQDLIDAPGLRAYLWPAKGECDA